MLYLPLAVVCLHGIAVTILRPPVQGLASNLFVAVAAAIAMVVCYRRSAACIGAARTKWNMVWASMALWLVGQLMFTWFDWLHKVSADCAQSYDFYYFLFGIPLLLAISSSDQSEESVLFLIVDSVQVIFAVFLAYLQIYRVSLNFTAGSPISATQMMYVYDVEGLLLAVAVSLRLLARPQGELKRLYRILCAFLWLYIVISAPLDYTVVLWRHPTGGLLDVLWDVPFLALAVLISAIPMASPNESDSDLDIANPVALLMSNGSPIIFTFAVLVMGAYVARNHHFRQGISAIAVALVLYGLRATMLQGRYMRTQQQLMKSELSLREANDRLEQLSFLDPLTEVANRRKFDQTLAREMGRARRTRVPLSLLMIDIDYFKKINDRHGHVHGDECLIRIAQALKANLRRPGDLIARYGGEEFAAILPNAGPEGAHQVAESMRLAAQDLQISNVDAPFALLTVSVGVATYTGDVKDNGERLIEAADAALYRAKSSGRNRVEIAPPWIGDDQVESPPEMKQHS